MQHHQQDEMVYDAGSVFIMLLSPLCLIWFPIVVAALALAGQKTLGHMVKKLQSGNFFYLELEILDAWKNRRQFRLTMAGIAYDGKGGDEVCLRTGLTPEDVVLHGDWVCLCFRSRSTEMVFQIREVVASTCRQSGFQIRRDTQKVCVTEEEAEHFFKGKTAEKIRSETAEEGENVKRRAALLSSPYPKNPSYPPTRMRLRDGTPAGSGVKYSFADLETVDDLIAINITVDLAEGQHERRYIRFPGGLQSYSRKSLCDLVTMETLMWYDEERQLVLVGYLYEFCAIVDINTEPAHFLEDPIFRLTDTVTVHPPGAMFSLDQRYWGLGISLKHPPGYRVRMGRGGEKLSGVFDRRKHALQFYPRKMIPQMTQMSYQSLEDPVIYMPGGLSNTIGGYADPDGKVHTPVPQNAKATEAGAPFPGDEAAASRAEMSVAPRPKRKPAPPGARKELQTVDPHGLALLTAATTPTAVSGRGSGPPTRALFALVPAAQSLAVEHTYTVTQAGGPNSDHEQEAAGKSEDNATSSRVLNSPTMQEQRVSTFLSRSREAMERRDVAVAERMAEFGSTSLLSITHGKPRKRLADATKLLAKWLEEHKASNGSKPAPADPAGSGAGEKICEEDSSIAMEQEQTRLVLDFVGLLDIQQASAGQSGDKNKKTTRKSKLPAKNRTKTATAQMTKLPAVEAHPQSAYVLLRNWLQSSQLIVHMGTQFGGPVSVMCVDKIIKTLDRVAAGERNWHLPQPGEKQDASGENYDAALMHLALLLCLFSDGILFDDASTPKAEQPHPACPEAVRMFAVTLFALAYPNRVFDSRSPRKPISVASGLPIRPNADQEQFVLCCFRDQSFEHVDGNRNQGKNAEGNEDAAAVDRAFAALMDPYSLQDLRVVCLTDCDVQKRTVSTPTTGQSERIFWLSRHDRNSWDVEVNREAFLHYEIVDCAEELERSRRVHRATVLTRGQNRELHFLREEDITDFDAQCVMQRWTVERIGMSCRSGVPCLGFQNLAGLSDAEIYRKSVQFVQRARVGEKILRAVVGLGDANLPSAHVANASLFYEERYSGISAHHGRFHVPFASLGARLRGIEETTTAGNDSAPSLKSCFTSALTKVECDNQELIAGLLERSGGKTSMVLPFLPGAPQSATDYALEDFFWERYAALADGDDADAEDEELPGVASAVLTMCAEEGLDVDTVIAEVTRPNFSATSKDSGEVDSSVVRACKWLHDPAIRRQQEKRAAQVQRDWDAFRHGRQQGSGSKWAINDGNQHDASAGEDSPVSPADSVSTACSSSFHFEQETRPWCQPAICCQKIRDALQDIGKKVTKSRKTVKHLRMLTKLGLLNLESELVRRNVRGSHITYHGPGGATTLVRNHRATAPLTSKQFVEKAQQLGEVGGERGGG